MASLATLFRRSLSPELQELFDDVVALEHELHTKWTVGREAHPTLTVTAEAFAEALGALRAQREFVLAEVFAADLYLARAVLQGDAVALARFEQLHLEPLRGHLHRSARDAVAVDEALQVLRTQLLLPPARKLERFTGQAPLDVWLRVVARRELLTLARREQRTARGVPTLTASQQGWQLDLGPEQTMLRARHRALFEEVLREAFERLAPEDRQLLRWHAKEGLSIDTIAPMLGVHRATVARMVSRVRQAILHAVQAGLAARDYKPASIDVVCAEGAAHLDVSLSTLLKG
jgi:RNA polymerase sigma-70 factor (ECF subfamily)